MSSESESDIVNVNSDEDLNECDLDSDEECVEEHPFAYDDDEIEFENRAGDFKWTTKQPCNFPVKVAESKCDRSFNISLERITSPIHAFMEFFDKEMMDRIVVFTNGEAAAQGDTSFRPVSRCTIQAWLGILINAGRMHANKVSIEELWSTDSVNGIVFYKAVMSRNRYKEITRHIRFDDTANRRALQRELNGPSASSDRLLKVRWFLDKFRENFSSKYNPSKNLTVDERIVSYRGRCFFIVYIKAEPHPCGIKIWGISDAENSFFIFFEVYSGKSIKGNISFRKKVTNMKY